MQLTVEKIHPTKSGKGYMVRAAGVPDAYYSGALGIEQTQGKTIDAEIGSWQSPSGSSVATIKSFSLSSAQPAPQAPTVQHTDRWYMAFVSNVCAHAIQSGLITDPAQLAIWASGAKHAADGLEMNGDGSTPF